MKYKTMADFYRAERPFRIKRVVDGMYYKGPVYQNHFTRTGKHYKSRTEIEKTRDDLIATQGYAPDDLEIVTDD